MKLKVLIVTSIFLFRCYAPNQGEVCGSPSIEKKVKNIDECFDECDKSPYNFFVYKNGKCECCKTVSG